MKLLFAVFAMLACLSVGTTVAAHEIEPVPVGMMQNTVALGETLSIPNNSGGNMAFTASIAGETTEPVLVPPGGSFTFTVPNDISLVGLTLTIRGTPLFFKKIGYYKTWTIVN